MLAGGWYLTVGCTYALSDKACSTCKDLARKVIMLAEGWS